MHFAHFEQPHSASDATEFADYVKRAKQGDRHAEVALRLTVYVAMAGTAQVPRYIRDYVAHEYSTPKPRAATKPPNRPNHSLRDQNLVSWIDSARYVRDAVQSALNVEEWAKTQPGMPTKATTNADIYREAALKFGVSAKRCKSIYEAASKHRTGETLA